MQDPQRVLESRGNPLYGSRHAISAGHYLAAAAGHAVLEAGGNAIDAGCAAGIALGVLCPFQGSPGGVAPIMIPPADGDGGAPPGLRGRAAPPPAALVLR